MTEPIKIRDLWRQRHRFCADSPEEIVDLDEARFVLGDHAGHGGSCLQFQAALKRTSVVCG
jgi:hypothetical protein